MIQKPGAYHGEPKQNGEFQYHRRDRKQRQIDAADRRYRYRRETRPSAAKDPRMFSVATANATIAMNFDQASSRMIPGRQTDNQPHREQVDERGQQKARPTEDGCECRQGPQKQERDDRESLRHRQMGDHRKSRLRPLSSCEKRPQPPPDRPGEEMGDDEANDRDGDLTERGPNEDLRQNPVLDPHLQICNRD